MSAPGDNLPRPATPGPWRGKPEAWSVYLPREGIGEIPVWLDNPQDAAAIAALPEWIAAHDAEREGRLRAEARVRALEEALEAAREPRAEKALAEIHRYASLSYVVSPVGTRESRRWRDVLSLITRYGFGGGS